MSNDQHPQTSSNMARMSAAEAAWELDGAGLVASDTF